MLRHHLPLPLLLPQPEFCMEGRNLKPPSSRMSPCCLRMVNLPDQLHRHPPHTETRVHCHHQQFSLLTTTITRPIRALDRGGNSGSVSRHPTQPVMTVMRAMTPITELSRAAGHGRAAGTVVIPKTGLLPSLSRLQRSLSLSCASPGRCGLFLRVVPVPGAGHPPLPTTATRTSWRCPLRPPRKPRHGPDANPHPSPNS